MDTNKIPEAERLFRQLGTYQKMKSMLDNKATFPVSFRIQTGKNQYATANDEEGVALVEAAVNARIAQLTDAIENL
jgi:hypothetical protein